MIHFPKLGITLRVDSKAFEIFGISVNWYGIIIGSAVLLCVLLAVWKTERYKFSTDLVFDYLIWVLPASIIGARLYYVIFKFGDYKDNLLSIFNLREGGLAIYGAIIAAIITTIIYCKKKKLSFLNFADFAAPFLALGQAIGRWGNFFNQEAYGGPTNLPWGMTGNYIGYIPVHPTFLYESFWNILLFAFLVIYDRKIKKVDGEIFCMYMAFYGLGRFWIEGLRTDSLMLGSVRVSQILAVIMFFVFIAMFIWLKRKNKDKVVIDEK